MFIKIGLVFSFSFLQLVAFGQDSTIYFPWIQDGALCQINAFGDVKIDSNVTEISYPSSTQKSSRFSAYELQGYYGFKDENGKVFIKAGYEKVGQFREGFAWVKIDHKRYYYINEAEEPLINFTFDRCFDFQNGLARVYDKDVENGHNGFGFINTKGEIVIPLSYKKAFDFVNGFALVQDYNLNWWLINKKGKKVHGSCFGMKSSRNIFSLKS